MLVTIALSGMDSATETALRAAFAGANAQLGDRCALVPEAESQHVIVDMDSMYGPMSWLRLHAAGKQVIGLTSAPRVQTHFRLARPFDEHAMAALLQEIAAEEGVSLGDTPSEPATTPSPVAATPVADTRPDAVADPAPVDHAAFEPDLAKLWPDAPVAAAEDPASPADGFDPDGIDTPALDADAPVAEPSVDVPAPAPVPAGKQPLLVWLGEGVLRGRHRFRSDTGPTLLIDGDAQQYHGPTTLKPLGQYFEGAIGPEAFESVEEATWARETAAAGSAQPLLRLRWLGALLAGDGSLAPGYDPDDRYTLSKWPQTEREYPRHFRIATAMMKGPATVAEIIAASGLPAEEIHRFVNANLATGYAEPVVEAAEDGADPQKSGGFFSRLRRR